LGHAGRRRDRCTDVDIVVDDQNHPDSHDNANHEAADDDRPSIIDHHADHQPIDDDDETQDDDHQGRHHDNGDADDAHPAARDHDAKWRGGGQRK
jgi:hypothetical protein